MKNSGWRLRAAVSLPIAAGLTLAGCTPAMIPNAGPKVEQSLQAAPAPPEKPALLPAGMLEGMVATFDGERFVPVAGASVTIAGTQALAVTDAEGRYRLEGIRPGAHEVVATKDGMRTAQGRLVMSPVMGTPRVNLAMAPAKYSVKQIAAFEATVTGVVTDPRGSALANATVKVLCDVSNNGSGTNDTTTANVNGFYAYTLSDVAVNATSPGQVQVTACGQSPGGWRLETTDIAADDLTGDSLVLNPSCDAFPIPGTPTWPNGTYSPPGSIVTLNADDMTSRTDEFHVRLSSGAGPLYYDVLPDSVATDGDVTFRIPYTLPDTTFDAQIVPFGLTASGRTSGWTATSFVTEYTQTEFDAELLYAPDSAASDTTDPTSSMYTGLFMPGDTVRYEVTLTNDNTAVSPDIALTGTAPAGSTISGVMVNGTALDAAGITQPDPTTGVFSLTGFTVPVHNGVATPGSALVAIDFVAPASLAMGADFAISNLGVAMPSAGLTRGAGPSAVTGALTAAGVDTAAFAVTSKDFLDAGAAGDGVATVEIVLTPTNSDAIGAFRITDRTVTSEPAAGTFATITGNVATTDPLNLADGEQLVLIIDRGAPVTYTQFGNNPTRAAFLGYLNNTAGVKDLITGSFDGGGNFVLTHNTQGTANTIEIDGTGSSATLLAALGLTGVVDTEFQGSTAVTADVATITASQAGTTWTVANATTQQEADGSVSVAFEIQPPADFGGADGPTSPITITYRITRDGGGPLALAPGFGVTVTGYNLVNYADPALFQDMNVTGDAAATTSNL